MEDSKNIVDAIAFGDKDQIDDAFQQAILNKVKDAINLEKINVASTVFNNKDSE